MTTKATQKIIEALTQLVEGFAELQEGLEGEYDPEAEEVEEVEEEREEDSVNLEDALVTEVRAAVEAVIENEDCAPEDLASIVSALSDALEEIDPEVFAHGEVDEDADDDDDDDDIDIDDDEDLDDDYDENEDEDEDEDEDDSDEDEEED